MSKNKWPTLKELQNSAAGKNGKNDHLKVIKQEPRHSVEKEWLSLNLAKWCNDRGYELVEEFKFCPDRKWRADWYIPALKLLCEYEGLFAEKSRHTTMSGYTADTEKYSKASQMGFGLIRVTAMNYKTILEKLTEFEYNKTIPF